MDCLIHFTIEFLLSHDEERVCHQGRVFNCSVIPQFAVSVTERSTLNDIFENIQSGGSWHLTISYAEVDQAQETRGIMSKATAFPFH
jgi:hypothetical protein